MPWILHRPGRDLLTWCYGDIPMNLSDFNTRLIAGAALVGSLFAPAAMAEVPAAVTTAIETAGTDAATLGGAVLVVIVGIAVFKWLRRAL